MYNVLDLRSRRPLTARRRKMRAALDYLLQFALLSALFGFILLIMSINA